MNGWLSARLRLMMFLQFFVWGAWYATAGNYMSAVGMTDAIYWAYMASPIGSIVSPFFLGMIADRYFPVQKVMGVMHLLSGVFVFLAPQMAEGSYVSTPVFLVLLLLHMLCYMPTLGLSMATVFHNIDDREGQFPIIRAFGSVGWIAAGFLVSYVLHADQTALPMQIAGVGGLLMAGYCFTLPHVPPPAASERTTFREIVGIDAVEKLGSRSFYVFMVSVLLTSIPLATYYAYAPVFLNAAGIADPAFKMTFGQMSEIVFLLLMPWFFARFDVKRVFLLGMAAWVVRYALFLVGAMGTPSGVILLGIVLHGVCYGFVYIAGQIYIDEKADPSVRAQAQGLFVLVTYGLGQGLGTLIAGSVFNAVVTGDALQEWQLFWLMPLAFAAIVTVFFAVYFTEETEVQPQTA